jgi:hypothetical protein
LRPGYGVIRLDPHNSLAGTRPVLAVETIDFATMKIGHSSSTVTEEEWLAGKSPGDRAKLESQLARAKEGMSHWFAAGLGQRTKDRWTIAGAGDLLIKARVVTLEPGFHALVMKSPAVVTLSVTISDRNGRPLDTITVKEQDDSFSLVERLEVVAQMLGRSVGKFLADRIADRVRPEGDE